MVAIYTVNNICKGIVKFADAGGVRLAELICNSHNVYNEDDMITEFAKRLETQMMHFMLRDNIVQNAEINRKTVIEFEPKHSQTDEYRILSQKIENNEMGVALIIEAHSPICPLQPPLLKDLQSSMARQT